LLKINNKYITKYLERIEQQSSWKRFGFLINSNFLIILLITVVKGQKGPWLDRELKIHTSIHPPILSSIHPSHPLIVGGL